MLEARGIKYFLYINDYQLQCCGTELLPCFLLLLFWEKFPRKVFNVHPLFPNKMIPSKLPFLPLSLVGLLFSYKLLVKKFFFLFYVLTQGENTFSYVPKPHTKFLIGCQRKLLIQSIFSSFTEKKRSIHNMLPVLHSAF